MASSESNPAPIGQIGIIVRDLQAAMKSYWEILGIGPWRVWTKSAPPERAEHRGVPHPFRARIAQARVGELVIELVQPLEGQSVYHEFLAQQGGGAHHLAVYTRNLDEAVAPFRQLGIGALQVAEGSGLKGDGRVVFLDTVGTLGAVLELAQPPSERTVEETYP